MTTERIPTQWVYACDRCDDRHRVIDNEEPPVDHPLRKWMTVSIIPLWTRSGAGSYRTVHLCDRCVRELGYPISEDEAPPPARGDGA
jgi:hypothetical protein